MGNKNIPKLNQQKTFTTITQNNISNRKEKKSQKAVQIKFNLVKLLNSFRNFEIDIINEKILEICHYQQIKYLNYRLFLLMFPKIKSSYSNFNDKMVKKIFMFFNKCDDGYIRPIHLLQCLSIIYYTDILKFGQVLISMFPINVNKNIIYGNQVQEFYNLNKIFFNSFQNQEQLKKFQEELRIQDYTINTFNQFIYKYFDINKFKQLFDCFSLEHQIKFIQEIKNFDYLIHEKRLSRSLESIHNAIPQTSDNRMILDKQKNDLSFSRRHHLLKQTQALAKVFIRINQNDVVYLVQMHWFNQWFQYLLVHHVSSLHFIINNKQVKVYQNQIQKLLDKQNKINKPHKLSNMMLIGQYQNELKPNLIEFQDFICVPKNIWQGLKQIYKGGPQIQRKYPYFYPIILSRVFVNKKGIFQQNLIQKYAISNKKKIKQIFNSEQYDKKSIFSDQNKKSSYYYICKIRNVIVKAKPNQQTQSLKEYQYVYQYQNQKSQHSQVQQPVISIQEQSLLQNKQNQNCKWEIIPQDTVISLQTNENFCRAFICVVQQDQKNLFQQNYLQTNKKIAYGDELRLYSQNIKSNIIQLRKQGAKIHHQGKNFICDSFYTYKELQALKNNVQILIQNQNYVPFFENQIIYQDKENINTDLKTSKTYSKISQLIEKKVTKQIKEKITINDSYMKVSLYCLLHSPFFSQYLLKNQYNYDLDKKISKKANIMVRRLSILVKQLFKSEVSKDPISLKKFKQILEQKCQKYKDKLKIFEPNQFITDLLQILEKQLSNLERFQTDIVEQNKNNNDNQQIQNTSQSLNIIKQLFSYTLLINKQFECCQNTLSQTRNQYILKLPINEDKQMIFKGIFYPCYQHKLIELKKYAVRMQLSRTFQQFSEQFFLMIKEDFPQIQNKNQLRFTLVKNGQFIRHFQKNNFESTLSSLNIAKQTNREQAEIIIYQLRQIQTNSTYFTQGINSHQVNFEIGSFIDFKSYSQWRIGKILENSQKYVKISNHQNLTVPKSINKQKVYPFKSKIGLKNNMFIEVLHRAQKDHKITYNLKLDPILINIAESMTKKQIQQNIINQISRYIRDYDIIRIQNKISKINKAKTISIKQEIQSKIKNKNYQIRYMKKNTKDICYFCDKKSKFFNKTEPNLHNNHNSYCYGKNYCKGIQIKNDDPIGWLVDLKKIYITIDWEKQFSMYERILNEHPSCQDSINYLETNKNDISNSIEFLAHLKNQEQLTCQQCNILSICNKKIDMVKLPNLLIIKLQRFKKILNEMRKIDIDVEANQILSLKQIAYTINESCQYELYAIICHNSQKLQEGNFYCYIKKYKYWIRIDEKSSCKVDLKQINTSQIYMAFYKSLNFSAYLTSKII